MNNNIRSFLPINEKKNINGIIKRRRTSINMNSDEEGLLFRKFHRQIMESINHSVHGKVNLPIQIITTAEKTKNHLEILTKVVAYLIRKKIIEYPNVRDFMSRETLRHLIQNESNAKFVDASDTFPESFSEFVIGNVRNNMQTFDQKPNHLILMYSYGDYERLDVITDFFTGHIRNNCAVRGYAAPTEVFMRATQKIASTAIDFCIRHNTNLNCKALYDALYIIKVRQCTNFRVSVAMAIYDFFHASVVYDPCAGWGDRAIAAALSSSVKCYTGTDTNTKLKEGYQDIRSFFQQHRPETTISLYHIPAEDMKLVDDDKKPDLIFTSPPFFDYEIYDTDSLTQCARKYSTIEQWTKEWLIPLALQNYEMLQLGGHMVYHLSLCGNKYNFVEALLTAMQTKTDAHYRGPIAICSMKCTYPIFLFVWQKK